MYQIFTNAKLKFEVISIIRIIHIFLASLLYRVECYTYYEFQDICNNNETFLRINKPSAGIIIKAYRKEWTSNKTSCSLTVYTRFTQGIVLCILATKFDFDCKREEYLNFTNGDSSWTLCDKDIDKDDHSNCYAFHSNVTISYNTVNRMPPKFHLQLNAFTKAPCEVIDFACANKNICIWSGYICDDFNNCLDNSDEYMDKSLRICINETFWIWCAFIGILPTIILSIFIIYLLCIVIHKPLAIMKPNYTHVSHGELQPGANEDSSRTHRQQDTFSCRVYNAYFSRKHKAVPEAVSHDNSSKRYSLANSKSVTINASPKRNSSL